MSVKKEKNNTLRKRVVFKIILNPIIYLIFIFIMAFLMSTQTNNMITTVILVITALAYTLFVIGLGLKNHIKNVDELYEGFEKAFGRSIKRLSIPVMYVNQYGKLVWENSASADLALSEYLPEINYESSREAKKDKAGIQISDKTYNLYVTEMELDKQIGKLILFIDKTKEKKLVKDLDDSRTVVGCIIIDSYEEIMQGLEDIDKFNTMAGIDKEIVEWISGYNGVVSKIEKDRYIYVIEKKYVKELEKNSFEILERMKSISKDIVKVPITISIGLSFDEDTLYGRYKAAMTALEVAMGRGGNQAVIKNNKKYDIYGDTLTELDKTNKVRARTIAHALKDIIDKSDNVYIMGHKNTDIDCVGAAVGIARIAKAYGKEPKIIIDIKNNNTSKTIIDNLKKLEDYEDMFVNKEDAKKLDFDNSLMVIVDTHKQSYLAQPDVLDEVEKIVIIDHHRRGPEFISDAILTYHEVYASSTSELVTELLMYLDDVDLSDKEAEAIFAGIMIDTKNFTFKTGVRTFEVAAYLKKKGLDMTEIKHLFQNDFETYMSKVNIVKNSEIIDGKIAISCAKTTTENMPIVVAQAADELLSITGILASFVLCEIDGVVMISARSLGDINVQLILERLGGGGHLTFAGAQIAGVTAEEAKEMVLKEIKEYFKEIE